MTDRQKEKQGSFAKGRWSSIIGRWHFLDANNKPECIPFERGSDHVVNNARSSTAADNNQPGESLLLRTNGLAVVFRGYFYTMQDGDGRNVASVRG